MKAAANSSSPLGQRVVIAAYRNRRRLATGAAMMLAVLMGYFAVAGDNGLTIYKQKRIEDRQLAKQIEVLKEDNSKLQAHVERLKSDPDEVEHVAREKLHYARVGEVFYTLEDKPDAASATSAGSTTPREDASSQPSSAKQ
jgi:cell division protein FtsB